MDISTLNQEIEQLKEEVKELREKQEKQESINDKIIKIIMSMNDNINYCVSRIEYGGIGL